MPYLLAAGVAALSVAGFLAVSAAEVPVLGDPSSVVDHRGVAAAVIGVCLLVADVVLPVPSSLVMVAHGALFGTVGGALLSLTGRIGAAAAGALIGRGAHRWVIDDDNQVRGAEALRRWGPIALVVSRPIPVLAESVAVAAGAAGMPWPTLLLAATLGALPEAVLYALAGAVAASFNNVSLVFAFVTAVSVVAWLLWGRQRDASA
ncbi:MAG: VTT domain-containing protein [Actinobacteria bacterium]|nr:VTT domain-containing protein [Actinomycetota bacterium]